MSEDKNEELRPTKMRGVAFPKAKYGVILAIILIISMKPVFSQCEGRYQSEIFNNVTKILS